MNADKFQNKNKRLERVMIFALIVLFSCSLHAQQINERALFRISQDTAKNTAQKHEYKPLTGNNDSETNEKSDKGENQPLVVFHNSVGTSTKSIWADDKSVTAGNDSVAAERKPNRDGAYKPLTTEDGDSIAAERKPNRDGAYKPLTTEEDADAATEKKHGENQYKALYASDEDSDEDSNSNPSSENEDDYTQYDETPQYEYSPRQPDNYNRTPVDFSTLSLIERALQDPQGMVLLAEEELPPADMPDSVYIRRLSAIPSVMSLSYNSLIRNYIVYYMQKYPRRTETLLGLCNYYLPIFEEILDTYNIPLEMRALPIIESALNPVAVSRQGATGMWQFMLGTARRYGLIVNNFVDERRDFIASTHAAAKYMNFLYSMFHDWTLALAAYNCGEGNVYKAVTKAGGKYDYWEIYPYLPKETRNYVPIFIAANYIVNYYREHRLEPRETNLETVVDTFMVYSNLHLQHIGETLKIPIKVLRDLNPQYKRDIIPGNEKPYELRIPVEYTNDFIEKEKEIYARSRKSLNSNIVVNPATLKNTEQRTKSKTETATATATSGSKTVTQKITHEVASGESMGSIAGKYKISVNDLCTWNNLSKTATIYPGQKLMILKKTQATPAKSNPEQSERYHTVQSGDSFWTISQKYNVRLESLLKANNMTGEDKLTPGKKIIIPN